MDLTVTIRCQACGNEEKTLNADPVWLAYRVPCAIEGECQKCHKIDSLYLVRLVGKNVSLDELADRICLPNFTFTAGVSDDEEWPEVIDA